MDRTDHQCHQEPQAAASGSQVWTTHDMLIEAGVKGQKQTLRQYGQSREKEGSIRRSVTADEREKRG